MDGRVLFPHSLGIFYQAITQYLGFPHYGDEYKVMGLAPYGQPSYLSQMRDGRDSTLTVHLRSTWTISVTTRKSFPFNGRTGPRRLARSIATSCANCWVQPRAPTDALETRHRDIARSVQAMYRGGIFPSLNTLHTRYKVDDLTLAGGCAMNSVANGKVKRMTPFKRVYVQSAAGDAGGAIGAAIHVWHKLNGGFSPFGQSCSALAG